MKIIFLDIDGVLNTSKTFEEIYNESKLTGVRRIPIDESKVKLLSYVISKTNAKIVLTSIWKLDYKKENNILIPTSDYTITLDKILNKYGIKIYDITPIDKNRIRQNEINMWLEGHHDIDDFVIIDDEISNLNNIEENKLIKTNFFEVNNCSGFCQCHASEIINLFNNKKLVKNK